MKNISFIIVITLISTIKNIFTKKLSLIEGGLYANLRENGNGYRIIKILKIDKQGYHIRIYSNIFQEIPKDLYEDTLSIAGINKKDNEDFGLGHLPVRKQSFNKLKLNFINKVEVKDEELEGYEIWAKESGGYFN